MSRGYDFFSNFQFQIMRSAASFGVEPAISFLKIMQLEGERKWPLMEPLERQHFVLALTGAPSLCRFVASGEK